ncbi:MAG: PAS domain S-box protein [candidate division Zixibacteria bacterium]|nr:PAS domain S-box protein [candidate division Zixibacteria bacterium]
MPKNKVLIVEDEGIVAMDIKDRLETLGYIVTGTVASGNEAIKNVENTHPEMVLMDIQIQGDMDGVEAAERILKHFDIPVIFLTANSDEKTLQRAKLTGPFGYLLKPFEERELHTSIEMALYRHKLERNLKEREQWLATTLSSIGDAVIATDTDGNITFINPVAETLTGWKKEETFGKNIEDMLNIVDNNTHNPIENPVAKALREKTAIMLANNAVLLKQDGTEIPIDDSAAPIKDDKGNITGVILVFRDITERKQTEVKIREYQNHLEELVEERTNALTLTNQRLQKEITERKQIEEALRTSEKRFRDVALSSSDWIWEVDENGVYTYISENVVDVLGYSPEELMGKTPFNFMTKEDSEKIKNDFLKIAMQKENIIDIVNWNIHKDGYLVCLQTNGVPILDDKGNLIGYRGVNKNITERERAEELLRQSEQKYRSFIESMHDGVGIVDLNENILFANQALCKLFGYSLDKLIGMNFKEIVVEEEFEKVLKGTKKLKNIKHNNYGLTIRKEDGQLRQIIVSATSLLGNDGSIEGYVGVFTDITDLKKAEKEKQQLREKLIRAQRMESIGVLAGGVAHDLNNILGPLVAYPEMIMVKLPEDSPIREDISMIEKSAQRAADVVQDLLTMARRGRYDMVPLDINELIESYLQSPDFLNLKAKHAGVNIKTEFDGNLAKAHGSASHISKVIMNLVINAIEAMPQGGELIIQTERRYIEKLIGGFDNIDAGEYIIITVKDLGLGIDEKDIKHIFEPFYSKKEMGKSGSGLGLAIVYGVIKDHNGYIDVQSKLNQGTEFIIYLPIVETTSTESREVVVDIRGSGKVLVVDDIQEQRELAATLLAGLGYNVEIAPEGRSAVEYLKENQADVVILDMIMEDGFDGLDTYKEILKYHPEQKAIIASGFAETDRVKDAEKLGVGKYVKKPYTMQQLGKAVKEVLIDSV